MCTHTHVYIYMCIHIHVHIYIHIYTHVFICTKLAMSSLGLQIHRISSPSIARQPGAASSAAAAGALCYEISVIQNSKRGIPI